MQNLQKLMRNVISCNKIILIFASWKNRVTSNTKHRVFRATILLRGQKNTLFCKQCDIVNSLNKQSMMLHAVA